MTDLQYNAIACHDHDRVFTTGHKGTRADSIALRKIVQQKSNQAISHYKFETRAQHRHPSDHTRDKKKRIRHLMVSMACLRGSSLASCRGRHGGGSRIVFTMVMGRDQQRFSVHGGHN